MENSIPDRYEKNPMLIIVENFVLDAIGVLPPDKEKLLSEMITRTFGGKDWRATVRSQLDLPADTQAQLLEEWKRVQAEADAKQEDGIPPEDFAQTVADEMFEGRGSG